MGALLKRATRKICQKCSYIHQDQLPSTIQEAVFSEWRITTLRTRNSAAYKGIYALLMRDGCRDFRTGYSATIQTYFDDKIDIHHVFPKEWCNDQGIPSSGTTALSTKPPLQRQLIERSVGWLQASTY